MNYNKDLIAPLHLYNTSHTLAHCDINESRNDELFITGSAGEAKEREKCMQSRWNPTPEQMMALEEVYSSGTRTPTTQQIQEIASKLQKYGRIEGKNVFYWFQNHKSRERLKRRRPDQIGIAVHNNVPQENKASSSVLRRRGDHRDVHTKTCFSSSLIRHPQNNDIDDEGKLREYERGLVEEKEATCQNLINLINTSDCTNCHLIITSKTSQEAEEQYKKNEEEEERRNRTLDLFPVNREKTDTIRYTEKNITQNQHCCNYYYYYEFMPL